MTNAKLRRYEISRFERATTRRYSVPGHAAVAPQHRSPQRFDTTSGAAHVLPSLHAACVPHMHAPATHASLAAQHAVPHIGPVVHVPDGSQLRPSRGTDASADIVVA
jgi:hypothetical protein